MFTFLSQTILHPMDGINQRYSQKRALYLAGLAQHIVSAQSVGMLHFSCLHGNRLRPVLLVSPAGNFWDSCKCIYRIFYNHTKINLGFILYGFIAGKDGNSSITLRIHALPPPDFLKPGRFHPQKNNIRTAWFTGHNSENGTAYCVMVVFVYRSYSKSFLWTVCCCFARSHWASHTSL